MWLHQVRQVKIFPLFLPFLSPLFMCIFLGCFCRCLFRNGVVGRERIERKYEGKGGGVVKTKEYPFSSPLPYVFHSCKQKKEGLHALAILSLQYRKEKIMFCVLWGGWWRWVFLAKKQNERRESVLGEGGNERRKRKGTGDPFRFYTTVNSNCTRWLMAFPFSLLFAKIPSYTSLISHSHANEDRSCNDILRWRNTPERERERMVWEGGGRREWSRV